VLGLAGAAALGLSACGGGESTDPGPAALTPSAPHTATAPRAPGAPAPSPAARSFHSRPDLRPARIAVHRDEPGAAPGLFFVAPRPSGAALGGPMILDGHGRLLWFKQLEAGRQAADVKVQRYQGRPVLTWGDRPTEAHAGAFNVVADDHYRVIATVRAQGEGVTTDLHDFVLEPSGTALVLGFRTVTRDLTAYGGPGDGRVQEAIVQNIDVATGAVLWTWRSLDHISLDESVEKPDPDGSFDYLHANSLARTSDGDILLSARHTSAVYKIDPVSGRIVWRLGGKRSDFTMGPGTRFGYQHDARPLGGGRVSLFDNADVDAGSPRRSSGMVVALDMAHRRARLVRALHRPKELLSTSQGNFQVLPGGGAVVGWGSQPVVSEFSPRGRLLFDASFPSADQQSYRAYKFPWTGHPTAPPDVVASRSHGDRTVAFVSWNGATEVRRWVLLAGPSPQRLRPVARRPWTGFETRLAARTPARWVAVRALDAAGRPLGRSKAIVPDDA
jgi:Arylsulfotransferase (ASST)